MEKYFGNYLGMVVTGGNKDPEQRGRCQVFVPHIMPALYDGWNKEGKDRKIIITGSNMPEGLTYEEILNLRKILPWAECAAPIIGAGPAGHLLEGSGEFSTAALNTGAEGGDGNSAGDDTDAETPSIGGAGYTQTAESANGGGVYEKAGGKRRLALADGLRTKISTALVGTGLDWYSHSGGQVSVANGGVQGQNRTGGPRHDNGRASDGRFREASTGRFLDAANTNDRAKISDALARLTKAGIKGIGWDGPIGAGGTGSRYMGSDTFHIDDVSNAVWGASKTSSTAASWVKNAVSSVSDNQFYNPTFSTESYVNKGQNMRSDNKVTPNYTNLSAVQKGLGLSNQEQAQVASTVYATAYQEAVNKGATTDQAKAVAAAITGNVAQETGFQPNTLHDGNRGYGLMGENGGILARSIQFAATKGEISAIKTVEAARAQGINFNNANQITTSQSQFLARTIAANGGISPGTQVQALFNEPYFVGGSNINTSLPYITAADRATNSRVGGLQNFFNLGSSQKMAEQFSGQTFFGADVNKSYGYLRPGKPNLQNRLDNTAAAEQTFGAADPAALAEAAANTGIIQAPKEYAIAPGMNTNNMPTGMFGSAREGQLVWIFFQEGNPLFPVYFAASYGQKEWQNITQAASPSIGNNLDDTWAVNWKTEAGGMRFVQTRKNSNTGLDSDFISEFYGQYGGTLRFKKSGSEFFQPYDHGQQIEGDYHDITLANRERKTGGSDNVVVEGDKITTVGDWSAEALEAATQLQGIINQVAAAKAGNGGGSTPGGAFNPNAPVRKAEAVNLQSTPQQKASVAATGQVASNASSTRGAYAVDTSGRVVGRIT